MGMTKVIQWVCCRKKNRKDRGHYRLAIKLDRNHAAVDDVQMLFAVHIQYGITVHYSSQHHNYFSAWLYVTKSDREFKECSGHPERQNQGEPRTGLGEEKGLKDDKKQGRDRDVTLDSDVSEPDQKEKRTEIRRVSAFEVSETVVEKGIKSVTELQVLANKK